MPTVRAIVEWFAFGLLRLAATASAVSGIALLAAAGAVQATGAGAGWVRPVVGGSLGLAVLLIFAGGISLYLRRARAAWLPEGLRSQGSAGSGFDGWLILFPLTLIGVPALMLVELRSLAAFWRDVFALADQLDFWQGLQRNPADSGYLLMPIFAALALPGVDAAAAASAVAGSALMVGLLLVRSTRVPRALLLCVILQGALVLTSAVGAIVVERLTPSIEQLVRSTPDPSGVEQAQIMAQLQRYSAVVQAASKTLAWGWGAIALWAPLLLLSVRARATFAAVAGTGELTLDGMANHAPDFLAMDDHARERAYLDAAQQVDRSTRAARWF
jgi:hypothetical protein